MPAYITWDQYERNQEQIRSNRPNELGPARAGSALLSGLIVCGRCGLRMIASYNNAGHAARYACIGMHTSYEAPFCQALKAEPVDTQVTRLILEALEPAAIEASLAAAADIESERAAINQHWRQRLERAQLSSRSGPPPLRQRRAREPAGGPHPGAGLGDGAERAGASLRPTTNAFSGSGRNRRLRPNWPPSRN